MDSKNQELFQRGYNLECKFKEEVNQQHTTQEQDKKVHTLFDLFYASVKKDPVQAMALLVEIAQLVLDLVG